MKAIAIRKYIPALIALTFMISGCATAHRTVKTGEISDIRGIGLCHTVRSGESLWQVARAYNIDVKALAVQNGISSNALLERGQVLVIPQKSPGYASVPARRAARSEGFIWPVRGPILSRFNSKVDTIRNKGIDIRTSEGADIVASRGGVVVFRDDRLKGFGKTVIIDHGDKFQTVYAYNSEILVRVGDRVDQNDLIARAGKTGRAKEPSLHFEVKKNGESCDPCNFLSN